MYRRKKEIIYRRIHTYLVQLQHKLWLMGLIALKQIIKIKLILVENKQKHNQKLTPTN